MAAFGSVRSRFPQVGTGVQTPFPGRLSTTGSDDLRNQGGVGGVAYPHAARCSHSCKEPAF